MERCKIDLKRIVYKPQETTMVNYALGKIYEIVCLDTGKRYIGSTTRPLLSQRLTEHRAESKTEKNCSAKQIILGGNYQMNLLETYPCETKDELRKCERKYIEELDCVNIKMPSRTKKEYQKEYEATHVRKPRDNTEHNKMYYAANKEALKDYQKQNRIVNKEKIAAQRKQHYEENKESILERNRLWRETKKVEAPKK